MTPRSSIFVRLVVPLGGTVLVAMIVAWAIAVFVLSSVFQSRVDHQLENATAILADAEFPFSPELIARLDRLIEARIALLDADGMVRLSTSASGGVLAMDTRPAAADLLTSNRLTLLSTENDATRWRVAVRPLGNNRDSRFEFVAAAASLAETRQATADAALLLGAAMMLATALLAVVAGLFTRSITRPLANLADMADRIAEGERDLSTSYPRDDEIGVLARALNRMSERLSTYEVELSEQSHLAGLGDLAARLAHEIRNPLTAIKMQLQLLQESQTSDDRIPTVLNEIRRMEMIVDSGLTLAAPISLRKTEADMGCVIGEVTSLMAPALAHRDIDLTVEYPEEVLIYADPDRLKQVLLNLVNNAADELVDGGQIRVSAPDRFPDGEVVFIVEDSGPGISGDDDTTKAKPFGLGLGLKICRDIIKSHGGSISTSRSESLGGAAFTITIPAPIIDGPGHEGL